MMPKKGISVSRRSVLKMISAGGVAVGGFSQISLGATTSDPTISEYSGTAKKKVLKRAKKHSDFETLQKSYANDGWRLTTDDSRAAKISNEDKSISYQFVVAGFESKKNENEQRYVVWTDLDFSHLEIDKPLYHVTGHRYKRKNPNSLEVRKETVQRGSIKTDVENIESKGDVSTNDIIAPPPGGGGGLNCGPNRCPGVRIVCNSYNWDCILLTAGAYVTTATACASCAFGSPSCFYCLGALLTSGGVTLSCNPGNNCHNEYACTNHCDA